MCAFTFTGRLLLWAQLAVVVTHLLTYSLTHLLTCSLSYLLTYSLTYLLTYLLAHLLTYLLTCLLTYLLTYLLAYLLTYLLTYLLAQVQDEAVILLASILESELTISYEATCVGRQLTKFNGDAAPARNLQALAAAVHDAGSKPFLKFEFGEWCAVLETAQSKKAEVDVLRAHDVASWCSPDVDPRGTNVMMSCITAFSFFSARGIA